MKIYVIERWWSDYTFSGSEIVGAVSTRELAEEFLKSHKDGQDSAYSASGYSAYGVELDDLDADVEEVKVDWHPDLKIGSLVKIVRDNHKDKKFEGMTGVVREIRCKQRLATDTSFTVKFEGHHNPVMFSLNMVELAGDA